MDNKRSVMMEYIYWMFVAVVSFAVISSILVHYHVIALSIERMYAVLTVLVAVPIALIPVAVIEIMRNSKSKGSKQMQ